jgi:two-component system, chemotaxis family, CheB/CheR fusion protein
MAEQPQPSPLVVVGASAGGIEALSTLVSSLAADFPAPLVIAQHLDPSRPSILADILGRHTTLPVRLVTDHAPLEGGVIFVVPASCHVEITNHALNLPLDEGGRLKPSIDRLFSSAAAACGEDLIAVVLTGTGVDGATGARAVKHAGGMVIVQDPSTAQYSGMPAAIPPPVVDVVAELEAIGPLLHDLLRCAAPPPGPAEQQFLEAFLAQVRAARGLDFTHYERPTLLRRVHRRVAATGMHNLTDYRQYLQHHPEEYERLIASLLTKVTEFFGDPVLFSYLQQQMLPQIVAAARAHDKEIRIWCANCATGEEAYSLAILVTEVLGEELEQLTVRIFATDRDAQALAFARRGHYPACVLRALPAELVARSFTASDEGYMVSKRLRSLVVFGEHDLGRSAPFPHIDLCLCRNVLTHVTPELQQRVLHTVAFALRDGGYLVLGQAETPSPFGAIFAPAHPQLKIYRRQARPVGARDVPLVLPQARRARGRGTTPPAEMGRATRQTLQVSSTAASERVLDTLPLGVVVVDRHYDIQHINAAVLRLFGIYRPASGADVIHLVQPALAVPLHAAIDAAFAGTSPARVPEVVPVSLATGEVRYLQIACYPQEPADTERLAQTVVILVHDVTEVELDRRARDEAEARYKEEFARLQAQMQHMAAANRELLAANAELQRSTAELRQATASSLQRTEEAAASTEEVTTLNEELQASNEELEELNQELQATIEELQTTNTEMQERSTDLQTLSGTLEAERAQLATILASVGDAVVVVDRAGTVVRANAAYARPFGDATEPLADEQGEPLAAEATPCARAARGETFSMQVTRLAPDGSLRWFEANGQPLQRNGSEGSQGVLVIRDITERKRGEEALQHANVALEQANALKSAFLATMSHEIRTPLSGVIGLIDLLRATPVAPQQRDYFTALQASADALLGIINDILDFSKIEAGQLRLEDQPLVVRQLVTEVVDVFTAPVRAKGLQLRAQVAEAVPPLLTGDPARLRQILTNLVGNAVKFTAQGSVDLQADLLEETPDGVVLRFAVRDMGIGIAAEAQAGIFDAFTQADASMARQYGGTGLGLAICRQLVALMAGTIGVQSAPGEGSTFWFTVRLARGTTLHEAPTSGVKDDRGAARGRAGEDRVPGHILVAEDNPVNQFVAVHLLEGMGYAVEAVETGQQVVDALQRKPYALVLMDCHMPEMDGFAATAAIRHQEAGSELHTPIVAMTADALAGDAEKCLLAGMDDYVAKPVTAERLAAVVARWAPAHR